MDGIRPQDLTGRARIREAALELFASRGVAATSVRSITDSAGVSPGLIRHHFGSKEGLRQAVDVEVIALLGDALQTGPTLPPRELVRWANDAVARVMGSRPEVRNYLRRSLLEAGESSRYLFARLLALAQSTMEQFENAGALRLESDPLWRPYQVLFLILGPLFLEPFIAEELGDEVFGESVVERRSAANLALLTQGILKI